MATKEDFWPLWFAAQEQRGRERVLGPMREGKPIDAAGLIDLMNWACSAEGTVMAMVVDDTNLVVGTGEPILASNEPKVRLAGAIVAMVEVLNGLMAAGKIGITMGPKQ